MSYSISTLLTRNLQDVFGESDPARRRAAIDEIFTEDCVFYEPKGVYRGRDEINRVAGVSLAALQLKNQEYEDAVDTAGKAVELDPAIGVAHYIQAVGNFNLNRLDAAEKSAREVEKNPHQNFPQLHVLLADILLQNQEYATAAGEMRTYLKEFPEGQFAGEVQKSWTRLKNSRPALKASQSRCPNRRSCLRLRKK